MYQQSLIKNDFNLSLPVEFSGNPLEDPLEIQLESPIHCHPLMIQLEMSAKFPLICWAPSQKKFHSIPVESSHPLDFRPAPPVIVRDWEVLKQLGCTCIRLWPFAMNLALPKYGQIIFTKVFNYYLNKYGLQALGVRVLFTSKDWLHCTVKSGLSQY